VESADTGLELDLDTILAEEAKLRQRQATPAGLSGIRVVTEGAVGGGCGV
jgi:hypothetical protein